MIQFSFSGPIPRRLVGDKVHLVTSRTTLFGVHKPAEIYSDSCISKTALVAFTDKKDAVYFIKSLKKLQDRKEVVDRWIEHGDTLYTSTMQMHGGSLAPLKLESSFTVSELQILCLIHYFDLYLAVNVFDVKQYLDLICYKHESANFPRRDTIECFMEDMYRKKSNI